MKIAIAQLNPTIGDLMGNADQILALAEQVSLDEQVKILITPELSLCGYPPKDLLLELSFINKMAEVLEELAQKIPPQLIVLVGTVTINPDATTLGGKPLYNSMAILTKGVVDKIYHKRLLPTYDVFDENRYFEPGLKSNFLTLPGDIKIGLSICEDIWNDEKFWGKKSYAVNPLDDLIEEGVNLIVNLSASPYRVQKQLVRESMLKYAASRYNTPIIYANQVGGNDDLIFDGSSIAINRRGEIITRGAAFKTDLIMVEYDEIAQDLVSQSQITPYFKTKEEEIWNALVLGVQDYAKKCGFSKAVLGLSGGIDSALVAAIAATALGSANVLGVLMPSPYSSDHSITDALELAQNIGIKTETIPIADLMNGFDQTLKPIFQDLPFGIAEENIQSRIRGTLLMGITNKLHYLLISTGNKSEMAVGYCTLYGDMNGGLAAIADVPKTLVYSICEWLNSQGKIIIPTNIITKAPSAELKPGQTDQDSLPPYEILDDILEKLIEHHQSSSMIIASGHDPDTVNRVVKLVTRAEFKRRQAPTGLKITDRAFGTGWRMPIAMKRIIT